MTTDDHREPQPVVPKGSPTPAQPRGGWWVCPACRSRDVETVKSRVRKCGKCSHEWGSPRSKVGLLFKRAFLWVGFGIGLLFMAVGLVVPVLRLVDTAGGLLVSSRPRLCLPVGLLISGSWWAGLRGRGWRATP